MGLRGGERRKEKKCRGEDGGGKEGGIMTKRWRELSTLAIGHYTYLVMITGILRP